MSAPKALILRAPGINCERETHHAFERAGAVSEYVHIKKDSAVVEVGDKVRRGQKVCESGEVGFSPEPHLHFTAFRTRDADAATCRRVAPLTSKLVNASLRRRVDASQIRRIDY